MDNNLLFNILLKIIGDNQVIASVGQVNAGMLNVESATVNVNNAFTRMVNHINNNIRTIKLGSIIEQIDRVSSGLNSLAGPGLDLNANMQELSAMTGVAGAGLKEIEGYARKSAKTFGTSASAGVESYKLILGQLSPEIAKVPKALEAMGTSVGYTSKLMGNDSVAATEVLTTAMNQYGISLDDPMQASAAMASMMNVMAAAAGEGSAELPQIKEALEQAGMSAKSANVSFEETNSAIQVLDKAGKKGSEGGVALRNVMSTLAQGRFLPPAIQEELKNAGIGINELTDKNKSLSERLQILKPLMNDSALLSKLFGKENAASALALISQTEEMDRLTEAITGTNTAQEQAETIMESRAEKNARIKAQVDDFKISLFNATNGWMGYAAVMGDVSRDVGNLLPLFELMRTGIVKLVGAQKLQNLWNTITTASSRVLSITMWSIPIVWIVAGIAALIAIVVVCWNKFEGFRKVIFQGWEALKLFGRVIKDYVINRFKELLSGITGIGKALWAFFKGDWKEAWETGKQAVFDLTGVGSASKAVNQVATGRKPAMNAGTAASDAYTKKKAAKEQTTSQIAAPSGIPGTELSGLGFGGNSSAAKEEGKKTNESIATGGTRHNYVTINLKNLIEILNIEGKSFRESASEMERQVLDALLRVTASATTAAQ